MAEKDEYGNKGMSSETQRMHAAGLLSLFSVMVLIEGAMRLNMHTGKDVDWNGDSDTFPPVVLLIGGVFEVSFGLFGLIVALGELLLGYGSPTLTMFALFTMFTGWFTFVVYTIAAPAFAIDHLPQSPYAGLTKSEYSTIQAMSILGSVPYCAALQGGQVFFANMLYNVQSRSPMTGDIYTSAFYAARLHYYLFLAFIAGLSQLIAGSIAYDSVGKEELAVPIFAVPYAILFPAMTITAAVLVLLYAFLLLLGGVGALQRGHWGAILGAFVFIVKLALMNFGQPGYLAGMAGGELGLVQIGLTLSLVLMPAYLFSKLSVGNHSVERV